MLSFVLLKCIPHAVGSPEDMVRLRKQGIIRQSFSQWNSPDWVVPKKTDASGKQIWRLVVDYRKLNERTKPRHPKVLVVPFFNFKAVSCLFFGGFGGFR